MAPQSGVGRSAALHATDPRMTPGQTPAKRRAMPRTGVHAGPSGGPTSVGSADVTADLAPGDAALLVDFEEACAAIGGAIRARRVAGSTAQAPHGSCSSRDGRGGGSGHHWVRMCFLARRHRVMGDRLRDLVSSGRLCARDDVLWCLRAGPGAFSARTGSSRRTGYWPSINDDGRTVKRPES